MPKKKISTGKKKPLVKFQSPPQELKVGPHSMSYLFIIMWCLLVYDRKWIVSARHNSYKSMSVWYKTISLYPLDPCPPLHCPPLSCPPSPCPSAFLPSSFFSCQSWLSSLWQNGIALSWYLFSQLVTLNSELFPSFSSSVFSLHKLVNF